MKMKLREIKIPKIITGKAELIIISIIFFISIIGFIAYFYGINEMMFIEFPRQEKNNWPDYGYGVGNFCFAFFTAFSFIKIYLLATKNEGKLIKNPILSRNPIFACIILYFSLILIFAVFVTVFDIATSYSNIATEFGHNINEYQQLKHEESDLPEPFLKGRSFDWFEHDTMVNDNGEFTKDFIELNNNPNRENLKKLIHFTNIKSNLIEVLYFSVQTISTLGYGNIIPSTTFGMGLVSTFTIIGVIETAMVFGIILGNQKNE